MDKSNVYFHLSDKDSINLYPNNTPDKFTVFLLKNYTLPGVWECALTSIMTENTFGGATPQILSICVDICEESFVGGETKQILERIPVQSKYAQFIQITNPCYLKVIKREFSLINVTVLDENLEYSKLTGATSLTLHLKKVKNG